jgi:predicted dehydrogenase/threonine dehydrogenase-like Zn-dependent dehydrogenase
MKQVFVRSGKPLLIDSPVPEAIPGTILISVRASCISTGTEMACLGNTSTSIFQRAISNPRKAVTAAQRIAKKGIGAIWQKAIEKPPSHLMATGYSISGHVIDVGENVSGFQIGNRVAAAGAGYANHAEYVAVPVNLVNPIPDGVDYGEASTVALGAIALQAVRRSDPKLGEFAAVIGCGAIGMIALQMLLANGCQVLAIDIDHRRLEIAKQLGASLTLNPLIQDVSILSNQWSNGYGVDTTIVFAASASSEPIDTAFRITRRKGRVVLAGVSGKEYRREDWYRKELDFLISTSYGPGRYDDKYEVHGQDYPYAYVRWTENRNMEAYLKLLDQRKISLSSIIEIREPIGNASKAYELLQQKDRPLLAILINDDVVEHAKTTQPNIRRQEFRHPGQSQKLGMGIVGGGNFINSTILPILLKEQSRVDVRWCCTRQNVNAINLSQQLPNCKATAAFDDVLSDPETHAVVIATRHNTHAALALKAIRAGKAVFLEKPLCLKPEELHELESTVEETNVPFLVGYNRRFSPFAQRLKSAVQTRTSPLLIHYTVNAGFLPTDHWTQGDEGGGRLMGEACHFIDLFRYVIASPVRSVTCTPMRSPLSSLLPTDNFTLSIEYLDGSVANLVYSAQGHKDAPKERIEIFFDNQFAVLDDFKSLTFYGNSSLTFKLPKQDKGHTEEIRQFIQATSEGSRQFLIPWEELAETWNVTWQADNVCRVGDRDE